MIEALTWQVLQGLPAEGTQWLRANVPDTVSLLAFTALCVLGTWLVAFADWHLFANWRLVWKRFPATGAAGRET